MNNDQKFDLILEKLGTMDVKIDAMDARMDSMESKMDSMESKMDSMDSKIADIESDVTGIKMQIENEIIPSIRRVAEGHLDLDRRLKEVITSRTEYELLEIRVNHLESAVERIEKKIS